ncbi:MAG: hypothetical protein WBA46_17155 [Thermomicrobiales bacterium]
MGSINDQEFLIQRETVPGTPVTTAMRSYHGLKAKMGYASEGQSFRGGGYRVNTSRNTTMESGEHEIEAPQCFNALLPVCASVFGMPVSTPLTAAPTKGATHVFRLKGRGKRTPVAFTGIYGEQGEAFQLPYLVFNDFDFGVQRSELKFETSAISRTPVANTTWPATGVTEVPAVPINSREYDVFLDDTSANWGTTQYLTAYDVGFSIGEIWGFDAPINSAFKSFAGLVENSEVDYEGEMQVGVNAAARALLDTFADGALKYVRIQADGPIIDGTDRYSIQIDYVLRVTGPGKVDTAPNSPTLVLPFAYELAADPDSGDAIVVTLTNSVLTV